MITTENAMKFDATEPNRGQFNFSQSDKLVNFAHANGMRVRGHTLVWHDTRAILGWVNGLSNADAKAALKNHVQTLVGRYKGKVQQWNVMNEAFEDNGRAKQTLMHSHITMNSVPKVEKVVQRLQNQMLYLI